MLPVGPKLTFIGQDLQKFCDLEDDFLRLGILGTEGDVGVEVFKDLEDKVSEIEGVEFLESDEGDVFLEGWLVEEEDYLLDVFRSDAFLLQQIQTGLPLHSNYI